VKNDFKEKFEEVGVGWQNENSISLIAKADIYEGEKLMVLTNNKTDNPKAPHFVVFRERKVKLVTEE
jgi:hypothetical protein